MSDQCTKMLSTPKSRGEFFLASSLRDGLEDSDIRQVETLLSFKDADPNVLIPSHGISPFHLVIGNESEQFAEQVTKLFLRHGGDPNVRSTDGMTPVHVAAAWGRIGVLELLLANGGDPLCLDDEGRSPFHYAFDGKYYDAVAILGKYCGASHSDEDESPKYKLTFDKMFVNKGNVVAEYVPAYAPCTVVQSESTKDIDPNEKAKEDNSEKTPVFKTKEENVWQSNNVTVRRYKKCSSPLKADVPLCERSIEDEKLLVGQIIRRLSNTLSSDSTSVTDDTTIIKREIKNARTKISTVGRKGEHGPLLGRDRREPVEFRTTPRIKLGTDTSIISKSPNCRISTVNDKTPKGKLASTLNANGARKNCANEKTPPRKLTKPPEVRVKSASSTPKKSRYSGRLYESSTIERKRHEKVRPPLANERRGITPKISSRINRDREKKIVEYSPDTAFGRKLNGKYGVRKIAVRLDERMYDENSENDFRPSRNDEEPEQESCLLNDMKIEHDENKRNVAFANHQETNIIKLSDAKNKERNSSLNTTADDEEAKILSEIEEAFEMRCGTPPASVSVLEVDDNPEIKIKAFHSDYSSGESSSFCEFHDADPGTMSLWSHVGSLVSVDEEYTYEDKEEGIAFTERHLRVIPSSFYEEMEGSNPDNSWMDHLGELSLGESERSARLSPSSSVIAKSAALYDDALLRERLTALGEVPGPITKSTFNVYLKRLWRLEQGRQGEEKGAASESPGNPLIPEVQSWQTDSHVPRYLLTTDWTEREAYYRNLEEEAFKEYSVANPKRRYKGGVSKTSFCYLLLDPRVTRDLPRCGIRLTPEERWRTFLEAVFYVGKGKAARPAAHLYDAFTIWTKSRGNVDGVSRKIRRILDIWQSGQGVVCLQVFSHTMSEEACSREASIIEAFGTLHLTNCIQGTYYGYTTTMSPEEKRSLGKYLLYKSMEILMHEGERQIFPRNTTL